MQRLYYLIYDDNVAEADICQQADPCADWPVESSSGLFNIASVCLRVDPSQRPDMEEVSYAFTKKCKCNVVLFT